MVCITFLYSCFIGYNFKIYTLHENNKETVFKKRGGVFRVEGKPTISKKKNCSKCAADYEWEIDGTTV